MRLLLSNDDGILAQGLECLIAAAEPLGEVWVVAPDREQSAMSHSLTLHHPVRPVKRGERRWQCRACCACLKTSGARNWRIHCTNDLAWRRR